MTFSENPIVAFLLGRLKEFGTLMQAWLCDHILLFPV
jgi:hypothetical protein